ncbi:hypothetical protein RFI_15399, partial [Reticulomyxa filosa]
MCLHTNANTNSFASKRYHIHRFEARKYCFCGWKNKGSHHSWKCLLFCFFFFFEAALRQRGYKNMYCMRDGQKIQYYPIDTRIKIIDFGSAVYEPKYDPNNKATWKFRDGYTYLIQTRHYRAPEVVLEMHWKRPVDVWSIGCVILEFLHGSMVFNTHCSIDHLNQMQTMIGPIPQKLIESAPSQTAGEMFHLETLALRMENAKRSRVQARSLE